MICRDTKNNSIYLLKLANMNSNAQEGVYPFVYMLFCLKLVLSTLCGPRKQFLLPKHVGSFLSHDSNFHASWIFTCLGRESIFVVSKRTLTFFPFACMHQLQQTENADFGPFIWTIRCKNF